MSWEHQLGRRRGERISTQRCIGYSASRRDLMVMRKADRSRMKKASFKRWTARSRFAFYSTSATTCRVNSRYVRTSVLCVLPFTRVERYHHHSTTEFAWPIVFLRYWGGKHLTTGWCIGIPNSITGMLISGDGDIDLTREANLADYSFYAV